MRIVFYSHSSVLGNGAAESLLSIVSGLALKHNCIVITPNEGALNTELTKRNIQHKIIPFTWSSNFNNELKPSDIKSSFRLVRNWIKHEMVNKKQLKQHLSYLKKNKPDIIYTNTSVINMGGIVAENMGVKHLWHLREFQTLDYKLTPNFGWWYFKKRLCKSEIIIANSTALKRFYSNYIPAEKIEVVYNGIEINNIALCKTERPTYKFLMVGILMDFKGHREAILAAKKLYDKGYDFKIDIVGNGGLKKQLRRLIDSLSLEKIITLHGQSSEVNKFYSNADCYLMCSKTEAFGRVTVEAMLHKLPVIGRIGKYSATNEIIRDGLDGLLYTNEKDLEQKMEYILNNKKKGIEMGLVGFERASKEFSLKSSLKKIEQIIINTQND